MLDTEPKKETVGRRHLTDDEMAEEQTKQAERDKARLEFDAKEKERHENNEFVANELMNLFIQWDHTSDDAMEAIAYFVADYMGEEVGPDRVGEIMKEFVADVLYRYKFKADQVPDTLDQIGTD